MVEGFNEVSLKDMIEQLGEDKVKRILSSFSCHLNKDVEEFIRLKSIGFEKMDIAPTQLVFVPHKGKLELCGYYTITLKSFCVNYSNLSKSLKKRIAKFGTLDKERKGYIIPAPLIAQLGKNYRDGLDGLISGDELLKMALDKIHYIQRLGGGKVVYVECEDKPKLLDFYSSNGFIEFGHRRLDRDETNAYGEYLIQLLKYMDKPVVEIPHIKSDNIEKELVHI